jgi:hypothetical protein
MVPAPGEFRGDHPMFKSSIALGVVLAVLAAGATAKTLKITKSEVVVQHPVAAVVQPRPAPATVDPAILHKHLQNMREDMTLP